MRSCYYVIGASLTLDRLLAIIVLAVLTPWVLRQLWLSTPMSDQWRRRR